MNKLELESEAIQISIYCNVICQILFLHRSISINKLLPFAYLIKKHDFYKKIYSGKNSNALVYKVLSLLSGNYLDYCDSIDLILKATHILVSNHNIKIEDDIAFFIERKGFELSIYDENSFFYNAIEDSKKMPETQFLKEVVQSV